MVHFCYESKLKPFETKLNYHGWTYQRTSLLKVVFLDNTPYGTCWRLTTITKPWSLILETVSYFNLIVVFHIKCVQWHQQIKKIHNVNKSHHKYLMKLTIIPISKMIILVLNCTESTSNWQTIIRLRCCTFNEWIVFHRFFIIQMNIYSDFKKIFQVAAHIFNVIFFTNLVNLNMRLILSKYSSPNSTKGIAKLG